MTALIQAYELQIHISVKTSEYPIQEHHPIKKGDQHIYQKNTLSQFKNNEITDYIDHCKENCGACGGQMFQIGKTIEKNEYYIDIIVKKIRHRFYEIQSWECRMIHREKIPVFLKEKNQYETDVQAWASLLMNEGYASMKRTEEIISGLTQNEVRSIEGYIAKLQKRLLKSLEGYIHELKKEVIKLDVVH